MAVLGMRGAGNFGVSDERPKHYRQMIMLLFPNGDAPLTAILSMLASQSVDDAEFRWLEKGLPVQRGICLGAAVDATLKPADDADIAAANADLDIAIKLQPDGGTAEDHTWVKPGHLLMNENTGEVVLVYGNSTTWLRVQRDVGNKFASNPAITGDTSTGDPFVIVGSGFQEGAAIGNAIAYAPLSHFNYTQIFRTPLYLTRTARKTKLRWDRRGPWIESRREALQLHSTEMEKAFLWGERAEVTSLTATAGIGSPLDAGLSSGTPLRTTRGIVNWLPTATSTGTSVHMDINTQYSGVLTEKTFEGWAEEIFRYGSNEKLMLAGSTLLNVLNQMAKNKMTLTAVPTDQTYGMDLQRLITPFGNLLLKQHPLMSHNATWRKDAIVVDVEKLKYRYVDDTAFLVNRQAPGDDASKDEYLTECGLEAHFTGATSDSGIGGGLATGTSPAAHGRLKGVSTYGG